MPKLTLIPISDEDWVEFLLASRSTREEGRAFLRELIGRRFDESLKNKVKMDFGWNLAFTKEPDGSFSWVVEAEDGTPLQSGVADSWEDARLAAIEHLYPPSTE